MDEFLLNGPADVHVVVLGGSIVCRNCAFTGCAVFAEPGDAFRHFLRHVEAKHKVRRGMLEGMAVASAVLAGRSNERDQLESVRVLLSECDRSLSPRDTVDAIQELLAMKETA